MYVKINPDKKVNGKPLTVFDPRSNTPFPQGPFELSDEALRNPRVLRLLPPPGLDKDKKSTGFVGGRDNDLVPLTEGEVKAHRKAQAEAVKASSTTVAEKANAVKAPTSKPPE